MAYLDLEVGGAWSYYRDFLRGRCIVESLCARACERDATYQDIMHYSSRKRRRLVLGLPSERAILVLTGTR